MALNYKKSCVCAEISVLQKIASVCDCEKLLFSKDVTERLPCVLKEAQVMLQITSSSTPEDPWRSPCNRRADVAEQIPCHKLPAHGVEESAALI